MIEILPYINNWFFSKQSYLESFSRNDSRLEGWFKGELFLLFDILRTQNIIDDFDREFRINNEVAGINQIDFRLRVNNNFNFLEIKSLCISQTHTQRDLNFYFRDNNLGLINEFRRLDLINNNLKWILGFIYPRPNENDWNNVCLNINPEFNHWECVSNINNSTDFIFISLWKNNR